MERPMFLQMFLQLLALLGTCSINVIGLMEGDIAVTPAQQAIIEVDSNPSDPFAPQNAVTKNRKSLWPNGRIPYVFSDLSAAAIDGIQEAMIDYTRLTCIRFVNRTTEEDYVRFFQGDGCYSYIGKVGGAQDISIGIGCEEKGTVIHEILHALGRWHEQSRPDRDMFVRIIRENIRAGVEDNFEITSPTFVTTQGVPYDLGSIMHYGAYAFSKNDNPTITPVDSRIPLSSLGQRKGLSSSDIQHVKTLYCSGSGGSRGHWSNWSTWTTCTQTCNGGFRSRTRRCVGGTACTGSNVNMEVCNREGCEVSATWSQWSSWRACSSSCGGGRQRRSRSCMGGMACQGAMNQFRNCNTQDCPQPAMWASWGSWSDCSRTCMGGVRSRSRQCRNGNNCNGSSIQSQSCNTNMACVVEPSNNQWSSWSECTIKCGGGERYRMRMCGSRNCTTQRQTCNTHECRPEPRLYGIHHRGCWYWNPQVNVIGSLEGTAKEVMDDPLTRTDPVRKCGIAVLNFGYRVFALTAGGYCISGSNRLSLYQYALFPFCEDGRGGYYLDWFVLDVYQITDLNHFRASAAEVANSNSTELQISGTTTANPTNVFNALTLNAFNCGFELTNGMFQVLLCLMCILTL